MKLLLFIFLSIINITTVFSEIDINNLSPYVHPPIFTPIPDGVKQEIPEGLGNKKLAAIGLVDITAEPFNADPTGKKDSTKEIQFAINFARDNQMVCFFPSGTYKISDTLVCRQGIHVRSHLKRILAFDNMPCVIIGSTKGKTRPKILLAPNSQGFNTPEKPKYLIYHKVYSIENEKDVNIDIEKAKRNFNVLFNAMIIGLDIVIGEGNSGAIAINMNSAEGSGIQDVTIDVTNGYAGIDGAAGNGGSWGNITIIGGQIGIMNNDGISVPTPTMAGITLINQTKAAITTQYRGSFTAVGLKIISKIAGPLIILKKGNSPFDNTMNLIDSEIIFAMSANKNKTAVAKIATVFAYPESSLYLNNVYVKNADKIIENNLSGNKNGWIHIKEFALGIYKEYRQDKFTAPYYYNGEKKSDTYESIEMDKTPPKNLCSKHIWDDNFPTWETDNAVNVKEAPYNVKGDSYSDDTEALQKAIDENEIIFLPKGYYCITKTLKLKHNTKLLGIAQHLSVIIVRDPEGYFGDSNNPQPMVKTANDKNAETVIAFCAIFPPEEVLNSFLGKYMPVYSLKWLCGRKSIFRNVLVEPIRIYGFRGSNNHKQAVIKYPMVWITENGGGKWYNYHTSHGWKEETKDARCILIDRTTEPIYFYNFEPQISKTDSLVEIRNSKNVSIFGCKTECNSTFLYVNNSDNIRIFGYGGVSAGAKNGSIFLFENTSNFLLTNISDQIYIGTDKPFYGGTFNFFDYRTFFPIIEIIGDKKNIVPSNERPVLYKRGNPLE